jgi:glycosyltransferase involved in cell wall biosynthesis
VQLCTIIARNYLAYARVLAESLAEHQPDGRLAVLVVDGADDLRGQEANFEVLSPADIGCDEFERMAARYDLVELATAVKPWLLRFLLGRGAPAVTYLDPDIRVFDSLSRLEQLGIERGLVLVPHNTVPIPSDGLRPTQMMIVRAGVFNLGYVTLGAGHQADRLLDWWSERLLRECLIDPANGYFVDQRWMDLVPGLVSDYVVVRDPEFNLAYWNLHAHRLRWDGRGYTVDDRPLSFFHFSGFDADEPDLLSRHQSRIQIDDHPAVARICREYASALRTHGHGMTRSLPYRYGHLSDGTPFDRMLRELFRAGEERGKLLLSPFEADGDEEFRAWATSQEPEGPAGINRALAWLYRERRDLREAFPDLAGAHRSAYPKWARDHGSAQGFPVWCAQPAPEEEERVPDLDVTSVAAPAVGVNVVGYFASELGVGEAARQLVRGLDSVGVPVLPLHGATIPLSRQRHPFSFLDHQAARYPLNVICMNADSLPEFASVAGDPFFSGRYSIGVWFWEVTSAPPGAWGDAFALLDEVWAPSDHIARVIAAVSPIPTTRITIPVEVPAPAPMPREMFGFGAEEFAFLFTFDYLSVFERKNPLAVIQAFRAAFGRAAGASLTIKTINHEHDPVGRARLHATIADEPDIQLIERCLDPEAKDALTAACDCYVSLHRSEGFGLTMAEAMYLGKPVIATGYSGNLDFMTAHNSYLVDYEVVAVGEGVPPYPAHAEWAEPDVEHAARLMRHVFEHRDEARATGQRAAADIRRTHSARKAGEVMRDRLASVPAPTRALESDASIERLADRVAAGPRDRTQRGFARRLLRLVSLRLMKPFTVFQRDVNAETVDALRLLSQQLESVRAEQLYAEAERLRQAREAALAPDGRQRSAPALRRIGNLTVADERSASPDAVPVLHALVATRELERPESAVT